MNPDELKKRRVKLTHLYLDRAAHYFELAAIEVVNSGDPFGCPSIAHAMASALDAQKAAIGAYDHIDPSTITKEI